MQEAQRSPTIILTSCLMERKICVLVSQNGGLYTLAVASIGFGMFPLLRLPCCAAAATLPGWPPGPSPPSSRPPWRCWWAGRSTCSSQAGGRPSAQRPDTDSTDAPSAPLPPRGQWPDSEISPCSTVEDLPHHGPTSVPTKHGIAATCVRGVAAKDPDLQLWMLSDRQNVSDCF